MYRIINKKQLSGNVVEFTISAPDVTRHARAGQFIILRVDSKGERVPFTIADYDRERGTVTIIVQQVGATTEQLCALNIGDFIEDFVGPLGNPTDLSLYNSVVLVGGGIGTAVIYPQAKQLVKDGKQITVIEGARDKSMLIYQEELGALTGELYIVTDNGSAGDKGFVTTKLKELLDSGNSYDAVFAVGPMPMMSAVCSLTREYNIPTIVSMNALMVDGTGMCGCCRVTVDGKTKYACVDGPEFDGHLIDFEESLNRLTIYREIEREHLCRLRGAHHE